MKKQVVALALATLLTATLFVSCGKKDKFDKETTPHYEPIEFTTDADGNKFIQNQDGDLIPYTTGKDGTMEFVDDLYTKPKEQADKEKEELEKDENKHTVPVTEPSGEAQHEDVQQESGAKPNEDTPKPSEETTEKPTQIIVPGGGSSSGDGDAHLVW